MKLWLIEWDDAHTDTDWRDSDALTTIAPCWTVGVIRKETDRDVEIVATAAICGMKLQAIAIPRTCIKRMRRLKIEVETPGT